MLRWKWWKLSRLSTALNSNHYDLPEDLVWVQKGALLSFIIIIFLQLIFATTRLARCIFFFIIILLYIFHIFNFLFFCFFVFYLLFTFIRNFISIFIENEEDILCLLTPSGWNSRSIFLFCFLFCFFGSILFLYLLYYFHFYYLIILFSPYFPLLLFLNFIFILLIFHVILFSFYFYFIAILGFFFAPKKRALFQFFSHFTFF